MGWAPPISVAASSGPSNEMHGNETSKKHSVQKYLEEAAASLARTGSYNPDNPPRSSWWEWPAPANLDQPSPLAMPHILKLVHAGGRQDPRPLHRSLLARHPAAVLAARRSRATAAREMEVWFGGLRALLTPAGNCSPSNPIDMQGRQRGSSTPSVKGKPIPVPRHAECSSG